MVFSADVNSLVSDETKPVANEEDVELELVKLYSSRTSSTVKLTDTAESSNPRRRRLAVALQLVIISVLVMYELVETSEVLNAALWLSVKSLGLLNPERLTDDEALAVV